MFLKSSIVLSLPIVRTVIVLWSSRILPPGVLRFALLTLAKIVWKEMPYALSFSELTCTFTARSDAPGTLTSATPSTICRRSTTESFRRRRISPVLLVSEEKEYVATGLDAESKRATTGSSMSSGRRFLTPATFSRTSDAICLGSVPISNSSTVWEYPSRMVLVIVLMPETWLMRFSIGLVTSVSISSGAVPS